MQSIKQLTRFITAMLIAFLFYRTFPHTQSAWLFVPILAFSTIQIGNSFSQQLLGMTLIGFFSSIIICFASYLGQYFILLAIFMFAIIFASVWMSALNSRFTSILYLIDIIAIVSGGLAVSLNLSVERGIYVLVGSLIVAIVNAVFWPRTRRGYFKELFLNALDAINELQKTFLMIYIKRDYKDQLYEYEKIIHRESVKILKIIEDMRYMTKNLYESDIVEKLVQLFEAVISQGHLRFRVKDYATFEIIVTELKALIEKNHNPQKIHEAISSLDDIYYNTLQVVSAEPDAFLFFIQAVKESDKKLNQLNSMIVKWQHD
jgi:hypothetical protein